MAYWSDILLEVLVYKGTQIFVKPEQKGGEVVSPPVACTQPANAGGEQPNPIRETNKHKARMGTGEMLFFCVDLPGCPLELLITCLTQQGSIHPPPSNLRLKRYFKRAVLKVSCHSQLYFTEILKILSE